MTAEVIVNDGLRWVVDSPHSHDETDDWLGPEHEDTITGTVLGLIPAWTGQYPEPRPVFLDVGAHVGHYTVRAAARGARVIAVEANPDTAGRLYTNVIINGLDDAVKIIPHAAWDQAEPMAYLGRDARRRNASGQARPAVDDGTGAVLWSVVLDDMLGLEPVAMVKIDTEGAEMHVLRGLRATLRRCRPVLWIEDHAWLGLYTTAELYGLLAELGYAIADGGTWSGLQYWHCVPAEAAIENVVREHWPSAIGG